MKPNEEFLSRMREATDILRTSGPAAATEAIRRALAGMDSDAGSDAAAEPDATPPVTGKIEARGPMPHARRPSPRRWPSAIPRDVIDDVEAHEIPRDTGAGKFLSGTFSNRAGSRRYKLYVPAGYRGETLPLVVMLHGCKQDPDDFATGTGMNRLADEQRCLVLYPAQTQGENGSNCWHWFQAADQTGLGGEPAIIAGMTRQIMREYRCDPERIYVAGLSAGGAMAAILASAFPELYAAVGIHSGLPAGAAHDLPSAFAAMKDAGTSAKIRPYREAVPVIVFHGDRDKTVEPRNGVVALAQGLAIDHRGADEFAWPGTVETVRGTSGSGRSFTRKIYRDRAGRITAEHWTIHGAGHAWSGGRRPGSFTDPKGPDASKEMLRFFFGHRRHASDAHKASGSGGMG
ncbi:MAG TPA: PHB depolymerase family esterase [Paucimonas sp.]|nr:PHB depolymerase family esterase [Paucimonas sp.]